MYRSLPSLSVDRLFLEHLGATRFVSYLSDAIFPPHAITELGAIGVDANTIAIGDGLTQIAVEKYSAFLGRYVFPPKHLLGVRDVAAGGNAKVLIKRGRASTAPKRESRCAKERPTGREAGGLALLGRLFFSICPKARRILRASPMYRHENNEFA